MLDSRFVIDVLLLENYHKFERFEIGFDKHLTVLVGDNGTGKTTVLKALTVAAGTLLSGIEDAKSPGISSYDARNVLIHQGSGAVPQGQYPVRIKAYGSFDDTYLSWSRSRNSKKGRTTRANASELTLIGKDLQKSVSAGEPRLLPIVAYYDANRFGSRSDSSSQLISKNPASYIPSRTRGYTGALEGAGEAGVLKWLHNMTIWELQEGRPIPELSCVREAVARSLSNVAGICVEGVRFDVKVQDLVVTYRDEQGVERSDAVGIMSEGYRSAMLMFADIARRMAQLNPQLLDRALETPGIVLIDEVDLHLHPRWQSHVLADLTSVFPNVQFIATTHSPTVLSSVKRKNVRVMGTSTAAEPFAATYGRDISAIAEAVMRAGARPADVSKVLRECSSLIEAGKYEEAEERLAYVETLIGYDDPDIVGMRVDLALEQL